MLVRWNTTIPRNKRFESQLDELNRWADQLFSSNSLLHNNLWEGWSIPETQSFRFLIHEEDEFYTLSTHAPGVKAEDLSIQATFEELTVSFHRQLSEKEGYKPLLSERTNLEVERKFRLPKGVEVENIGAKIEDGVLEVKIPKAPEVLPRKIDINIS